MDPKKRILGKKILIVDDEKDILDTLIDLLELGKIDAASSFEEAKEFLEKYDYDIAILDLMGVQGYKLLEIANKKEIPSLILTAHGLTPENLKKSAEEGAAYFVPKEEMGNIVTYVADVLEAKEKNKNPWQRWFDRLSGVFDVIFTGPDWRDREKEFWDKRTRDY
ncbi:MAG: response regulator [Deltaproteobacteria bacterium]|nr:response regulator [Deltaproteobacteria bacterium]